MPAYPNLSEGHSCSLPYVQRRFFPISRTAQPTGWQWAYSWRATPLMRWELHYSTLSDVNKATLQTFFEARFGRYEEFEFTDPETSTLHTRCRFGIDELEIRHIGPNHHSTTIVIEEYKV